MFASGSFFVVSTLKQAENNVKLLSSQFLLAYHRLLQSKKETRLCKE